MHDAGSSRTILLLGGSRHQVPAIETAKRLGYRTVLCDYLPDNPGRLVADVFYQESTVDRELMLAIARTERVEGVLSFGSDVAAPTAAYIAEEMGLPGNPLRSVEILSEKSLFRPYLENEGFNCPRAVSFASEACASDVRRLLDSMRYPIVLKPTDSSGSRGVSVIDEPSEESIARSLSYAREFSRNGTLVAEEYIEYSFPHLIGGDIFVAEGVVRFWGLMSCLRDRELAALVPVGKAYPTGLPTSLMSAVKDEVQHLVSSLGLSFGEMNVEVIIGPEGRPYVLELGARAGGNMIPLQLQDISGIDLIEALVRYTMGDGPVDVSFDSGLGFYATSVLHARETGVFEGVEYAPEVARHIYRELVYVVPGDHVDRLNYGSKAIGVVFLRFDDEREMWDILDRIEELVHVKVGARYEGQS